MPCILCSRQLLLYRNAHHFSRCQSTRTWILANRHLDPCRTFPLQQQNSMCEVSHCRFFIKETLEWWSIIGWHGDNVWPVIYTWITCKVTGNGPVLVYTRYRFSGDDVKMKTAYFQYWLTNSMPRPTTHFWRAYTSVVWLVYSYWL